MNQPPPRGPPSNLFYGSGSGGDEELPPHPIVCSGNDNFEDYEDQLLMSTNSTLSTQQVEVRGGSSSSSSSTEVVKGAKSLFPNLTKFWKTAYSNLRNKIQGSFKSKKQKQEEELIQKLQTMPVKAVVVPPTSVVPPEVVRMAVKRSGLIGNPLRTDRVQEIARSLKRWYMNNGYVLHSVTGANLKAESATAVISVEEPKIAKVPVDILVLKEMVVDDDNDILTLRQYRKKHADDDNNKKSFRPEKVELKDLNTTFVPTRPRTKSTRIAQAMNLQAGKPFQWDGFRWQKIASSGIFSRILKTAPTRTEDGTICLQVYATEPPPRHLEYGVGKSTYTGIWEGEVDFEHQNLFGGGETLGMVVRRGTKDEAPSVRIKYNDDHFGLEGGYELEVFTDFIGDGEGVVAAEDAEATTTAAAAASSSSSTEATAEVRASDVPSSSAGSVDYEHDSLLNRRGATFRLKNPVDQRYIQNSAGSIVLERTSTRTGLHENLGSASLTLGPIRQQLPMDARSSLSTTLTGGARVGLQGSNDSSSSFLDGVDVLPYSQISATTRQILPLASNVPGTTNRQPLTLALQHVLSTSTPNIPRHERKAMGISTQIRGAEPDGGVTTSVKGTAELRLPILEEKMGTSMVFFGDWFYAQRDHKSPFYAKSSIGIGVRKNFQGLPLKYDACYSNERNFKQFFGLGIDFDA